MTIANIPSSFATTAFVAATAEQGLVATSVKTSAYTAVAGDEVLVDISAGNVTITLPNAPADKTRIALKVVAVNATPGTYAATLATAGTDHFNKSGGSTSLTFSALFQGSIAKYSAGTGIWTITATDDALGNPLGAAKLGSDGKVGGPSGSALASSVVSAASGGGIPAWAASTAYAVNALVTNGGSTYICNTAHTSGSTFSGESADWQAIGSGAGAVSSVFTRTGAVVATTGDYTVSQVTGAAPLASPALTGAPTAPTATALTSTTQVATTAYADSAVGVETSRATTAEALKAPLASPALTGSPTAPTQAALDSTTKLATTAYADSATAVEKTRALAAEALLLPLAGGTMSGAIAMGSHKVTGLTNGSASSDAAAFGQIPVLDSTAADIQMNGVQAAGSTGKAADAGHVHPSDTSKAALASPTFTGTPAAPTAAQDTNTTQVATTAFVLGQTSATVPVVDGTAAAGSSTRYARSDHVHPTDTSRAALASPALTGTPTAPTQTALDNSTKLATTAYADAATGVEKTRALAAEALLAPLLLSSTAQTGSTYTFALADVGTVVEGNSATAQTFTIPTHASVAWSTGTLIEVFQLGAGQITIAAAGGVTLRSDGSKVHTAAQYASIGLRCRAQDDWVLTGDLS